MDSTLNTQGVNNLLDIAFTSMEFFIKHFTKMKNKHKENPYINARVLTAWFKFDDYYKETNETSIYTTLVLLYPKL